MALAGRLANISVMVLIQKRSDADDVKSGKWVNRLRLRRLVASGLFGDGCGNGRGAGWVVGAQMGWLICDWSQGGGDGG